MKVKVMKLSGLPVEMVTGHHGFSEISLLDPAGKGPVVRLLTVQPGGVGPTDAHSHRERHLFIVLEGNLELEVDGNAIPVPAGSFASIAPYTKHQLRCRDTMQTRILAIKWDAGDE